MKIKPLVCERAKAYIYDDIARYSDEKVNSLMKELPKWRHEKALLIRHPQVRKENVLSFLLLRKVLLKKYGIDSEIKFSYSKHGKPFLEDYPEIFFNISHCRKGVACVVGNSPVGIDIERRGRFNKKLALDVLSDNEYNNVSSSDDIDLEFTILWTKKEAVLKLLGIGVGNDMKSVLREQSNYNFTIYVDNDYVCCVAEIK